MQVSVETLNNLERRMTIEVPTDQVETEVDTRLKKMLRSLKVNGFRPGKVPLSFARSKYGSAVLGEVLEELAQSSLRDAFAQEQIEPVTPPVITDITPYEAGKPLSYAVTFTVMPEFELAELGQIEIKRLHTEITQEDLEKTLYNMRRQNCSWTEAQRPIQSEDRLTLDFEVLDAEKQAIAGTVRRNIKLVLGFNKLTPHVESKLVGMSPGADEIIPLYADNEPMQGQGQYLRVKIHRVEQPLLPEIGDEKILRHFDVPDEETLLRDVRANMEAAVYDAFYVKMEHRILSALIASHPLEVPESVVQRQALSMYAEDLNAQADKKLQKQKKQIGIDPDNLSEQMLQSARTQIMIRLILDKLEKNGIYNGIINEQDVSAEIEDFVQRYENSNAIKQAIRSKDKEIIQQMHVHIRRKRLVDTMLTRCNVIDEHCSAQEMLSPVYI